MSDHGNTETAAQEFRSGWRVLLASAMGVTCGITAIPIYTIGAFVGPLEDAYGWSRGAIQSATVFAYLTLIFAGPVAGYLTDHFGPRRVALWSVFGISAAVGSASILAGSLWGLYLAYALIGILGAGTSPVVWTRAVSSWFVKKRGLAFGLTLMGTGLFATVGPIYVTFAIAEFGWRGGYLALAIVPIIFVLPLVYFWFYEKQDASKTPADAPPSDAGQDAGQDGGIDLRTALRTSQFWIIGFSFLFFSTSISGFIASYIPMLTDSGLTRGEAASMAGFIGISVILGRVVTGFLLDHVRAAVLSTVVMALPAIGCLLWGIGVGGSSGPLIAAIFVGLAGGAEFDLVAYMTSRYFGLKHYGKLYGILFSSVIAGAAIGPLMFGFGFDMAGSYSAVLLTAASLFVVGGVSQLFLGNYPETFSAASPGGK
jgi:OFA family oxalate/formate antiporter-like MFS transporter